MTFTIDRKLLFRLTLIFILMTIVGTVSHEGGHWLAAKLMGFDARINYMSTSLTDEYAEMSFRQELILRLGGPLQTMITGTIGLILLCIAHERNKALTTKKWIFIFLALFWLRQSANFTVWVAGYLITGQLSANGDEIVISEMFAMPQWIIVSVTALVGFVILGVVIFKFIPVAKRFTFILSGLIGGIGGYLLWLVWFGKYIMP